MRAVWPGLERRDGAGVRNGTRVTDPDSRLQHGALSLVTELTLFGVRTVIAPYASSEMVPVPTSDYGEGDFYRDYRGWRCLYMWLAGLASEADVREQVMRGVRLQPPLGTLETRYRV